MDSSHRIFLGVDGGGTKTEFVLIDATGVIRARHQTSTTYYLQIGFDGLAKVLGEGIAAVLGEARLAASDIEYGFLGLPAYGEDSQVQQRLDDLPETVLGHRRYTCGNDMVCGWAGALAVDDGINIAVGTGSIGYGERRGISARCGGWGEIFSDEGSAYWIAVQGLNAFSRMSDGRAPISLLYHLMKAHFAVEVDLDLCGKIMTAPSRDMIAALSKVVAEAASQGDAAALAIFESAAFELAKIVEAIRRHLGYEADEIARVSYSGGVFRSGELLLEPFRRHLAGAQYALMDPIFAPSIGAALNAARLSGHSLSHAAVGKLPRLSMLR
jgi:N-acetylglucosamine kinase-like BadF-type ATPase